MIPAFGIVCESMPVITVVILLALLAIPKRLSAATRHQALLAAAVIGLLTPALLQLMPKWQVLPRVNRLPQANAVVFPNQGSLPSNSYRAGTITSAPCVGASSHAPAIVPPMAYHRWFRFAATIWFVGVALSVLRIALQWRILHRAIRAASPASEEIHRIARSILGRTVEVRIATNGCDAFVHGVVSPVVVLPVAVKQLPYREFHMILTHELAHLKRRDPLCNWILQLFLAVYWMHPLAWVLVKRCRLAQEMATDDMVLLSGSKAETYAACLCAAGIRHRNQAPPPAPAAVFSRQHPLLSRVHAILDTGRHRTISRLSGWISAAVPIAAPALLLASLGFKAASEVQPIRRAQSLTAAKSNAEPSLWSDVIEPLAAIKHSLPSHQSASPGISASIEEATPSLATSDAPPSSLPAQSHQVIHRIPPSPTMEDLSEARDVPSESLRELPARSAKRSHQTVVRASQPSLPTSIPSASSEQYATVTAQSELSIPPTAGIETGRISVGAAAPPGTTTGGSLTVSSMMMNAASAKEIGATASNTTISEVTASAAIETQAVPEHAEGITAFSALPLAKPSLEMIPYISPAGPHLAVAWTVPASQTASWIPEVSRDLTQWTASPEAVTVFGPVPTEEGLVRFLAVVREPIAAANYQYLRLSPSDP